MKKLYGFAVFLALFAACSQKQMDYPIVRENNRIVVHPKKQGLEDLFGVDELAVHDSLCVLIDRYDSCFFHVYNLNRESWVCAWGTKGQGPGDFLFPFFLSQQNVEDSLSIYDPNMLAIKTLGWADLAVCQVRNPVESKLPVLLAPSPRLIQCGQSYWGSFDIGVDGLFFRYQDTDIRLNWTKGPQWEEGNSKGLGNRNCIAVNDSLRRVASAFFYYNRLLLFNQEGELLKGVQIGEENRCPVWNDKGVVGDESYFCGVRICSDKECIYLLAQDWQIKDAHNHVGTSRVVVFDWDLNYQSTYVLPVQAWNIAIDSKNRRLLYIAYTENDERVLGWFDLHP